MTKFKAAFIHLIISVVVISLLFIIIYTIWYPKPLFSISDVITPLKLLIMVDVIVGPLLTFIIYKKNKSSLVFDLSVIGIMQIIALLYGAYTIYNGKPSMVVMQGGQFHYLTEKFAKYEDLKFDELRPGILSKPQYGFIARQTNLDIYNSYADIEPISDYQSMVLPNALTVENMSAKFTSKSEQIDALNTQYKADKIVFFQLQKDQIQYYVVFSTTQNKIIDYLKF